MGPSSLSPFNVVVGKLKVSGKKARCVNDTKTETYTDNAMATNRLLDRALEHHFGLEYIFLQDVGLFHCRRERWVVFIITTTTWWTRKRVSE